MGLRGKKLGGLALTLFVAARALGSGAVGVYALENAFLRRVFSTEGGVLRTIEIANKRCGA